MTLRPTVPCFGVVPLLWKALAASACQTLRTLLALWRTNSAPRTAFFMWNAKIVKLNCNIWLFVFMWLSCGSFLHPMCVSRGSRSAAALRQPIHPCGYAHAPYGRIMHRTRFVWYSRRHLHIYLLTQQRRPAKADVTTAIHMHSKTYAPSTKSRLLTTPVCLTRRRSGGVRAGRARSGARPRAGGAAGRPAPVATPAPPLDTATHQHTGAAPVPDAATHALPGHPCLWTRGRHDPLPVHGTAPTAAVAAAAPFPNTATHALSSRV